MSPSSTLYLREDGLDDLIVRPKDENDSAIPAPGSVLLVSLSNSIASPEAEPTPKRVSLV